MWRSEDSSWEAALFLHLWVKDLDFSLSDFVAGAFKGCLALGASLSFPVRYLLVVYRDFSAHLGSSVNLFSYILVSTAASCCFLSRNLTVLRPLLHGTVQHQLLWPRLRVLQGFLLLCYCSLYLTQYSVLVIIYLLASFAQALRKEKGTHLFCLFCSCIPSTGSSSCSINVCRMCSCPCPFSSAGYPSMKIRNIASYWFTCCN